VNRHSLNAVVAGIERHPEVSQGIIRWAAIATPPGGK
jgi:hypothetical protein